MHNPSAIFLVDECHKGLEDPVSQEVNEWLGGNWKRPVHVKIPGQPNPRKLLWWQSAEKGS